MDNRSENINTLKNCDNKIKLNVKMTIFMSLAMVIWGVYLQLMDSTVQIVIVQNLGKSEEIKGIVLLIANLFIPVIFLNIFAKMSDNSKSKMGRRAPFIIIGTIIAAVLVVGAGIFAEYNSFWGYTIFFILAYLGICVYRPAAMAILPDVTPKPVRSQANAIKGIVNGLGGLSVVILIAIFGSNILPIYVFGAIFMIVILILYIKTIDEPKLVAEADRIMAEYDGIICDEENKNELDGPIGLKYIKQMPKGEKNSLMIIIGALMLAYFGYGAIIATQMNHAVNYWGMTNKSASVFMILFGAGGIVATPIIAYLSVKRSRKFAMVLGSICLVTSSIIAIVLGSNMPIFRYVTYFFLGAGWGFISIISLPMILELSDKKNNAFFTGFYMYACTIAKAFTSYLSGWFISRSGVDDYSVLFPYSIAFFVFGGILICFAKHGNVKPPRITLIEKNV